MDGPVRRKKASDVTGHKKPDALRILAGAYAAGGRLGEAVKTTKKALEISRAAGDPSVTDRIEEMLEFYERLQAGKPE